MKSISFKKCGLRNYRLSHNLTQTVATMYIFYLAKSMQCFLCDNIKGICEN